MGEKLTDDDICTVATILCRQAGWEPDGLYSVDGAPLIKGWKHFENKARALLLPHGDGGGDWVTVPKEPTPEMIAAVAPRTEQPSDADFLLADAAEQLLPPVTNRAQGRYVLAEIVRDYRALLSAAPAAPVGEGFDKLFTLANTAAGYPSDDEDQSLDAQVGREFITHRMAIAAAFTSRESDARPITMQDVRLAVGEGPLTPADVLAGCNAELARRASHRVPKADHIGRLNEMVREAEAREDEIAALVEAAAEAERLYVQADNEVGRLRKALEPFAAFSARFPKAKGNILPMGVHPGPPHEPTMRDFHHAHDLIARLERAPPADQHTD